MQATYSRNLLLYGAAAGVGKFDGVRQVIVERIKKNANESCHLRSCVILFKFNSSPIYDHLSCALHDCRGSIPNVYNCIRL